MRGVQAVLMAGRPEYHGRVCRTGLKPGKTVFFCLISFYFTFIIVIQLLLSQFFKERKIQKAITERKNLTDQRHSGSSFN